MKLLNPAAILRAAKQESERKRENLQTFTERLRHALQKHNKVGRNAFVEKLKSHGISALDMKRLAEESFKDQNMLIKWERKAAQENKAINLALVKNRSAFSKILIIVRELYAEGIAEDISFDDAAKLVIDEVLLKP